ncbi:arsenate reductase family protein [Clostridium sp. KNHs216]|uniref:arsenate reductase family protein n=1 Tax=Eubacteriales TaxID=186802 RepID=UPI001154313A|nr:arsenate reductase family protein [Clostridium sp. KNHs216]TQI66642.1 arsenate reductase [Clostridium sp. KNHs216]
MSLFVCYPKCTTCQKAKRWLQQNGIAYEERNIKEQNPTVEELKEWHRKSGLELKKFFNTSGLLYKSLGLSKKLPSMSEEEQFALLATDGMLVKRPILVDGGTVLVGFRETQWEILK